MKNLQSLALVLAVLAVEVPVGLSDKIAESPLSKVIALLGSLADKIEKEGAAEAKAHKEYVAWCTGAAQNLGFEITTAEAEKINLEATIGKATGDAQARGARVEDLAAAIAADDTELRDAAAVREKEAASFAASEAELVESIDTLTRAVAVFQSEMRKHPSFLAQVDTSNLKNLMHSMSLVIDAAALSSADQRTLLAFVQSQQSAEADDEDLGAPAPAAYKTHSRDIVDLLEDLKEKAEVQLSELRKAEVSAKHNYEILKQSLEDQVAADTKELEEEKTAKAAVEAVKKTAEGDLMSTVKDLANAKETLESTNMKCTTINADHESSVQGRVEELAAIAKAKEILSTTTAGAAKQTYSLLQLMQVSKLGFQLQTRAGLANAEVLTLVKRLARELNSRALAQLASRIATVLRYGSAGGEDPLVKVKSLLTKLIDRLESEAGADATEKAYCDEELANAKAKKAELDYDIEKLTAKIDQSAASSAKLMVDVKELQAGLAALATQQAEMDSLRSETRADYIKAKADLELGLSGVRRAIVVLREYYGSEPQGAAMLQRSSKHEATMQQPELPEQHAKAGGAGWVVVETLEVVQADFAKNLAMEETQEADAQAAYEQATQENNIMKTLKTQDVEYKTQEFNKLDKSTSDVSGDRETSNAQLSAVMEYLTNLRKRCIMKPETYDERGRRRQAEISGLKQALAVLDGRAVFLQEGKTSLRSTFLHTKRP